MILLCKYNIRNPVRVCEELYYHSAYNPKYISELNKALEQIGIKDSRTRELPLFVKEDFKKSDLSYGRIHLKMRFCIHLKKCVERHC